MAVRSGMFIYEVYVESVKPFVDVRTLILKSEFSNIFALELKDPKSLHIIMPEPPPLPPEPPGKKKGKKAKPKPKKGKKGAKEPPPPPEPVIQAGQSVLFTSTPEFLIQTMKKNPMEVSAWAKEDREYVGSTKVTWDPTYISYCQNCFKCKNCPPVTVTDEYNVWDEETGKLMATIGLSVKLSYYSDLITSSFRTLSEDDVIRKVLYTGMNSKKTSFIVNYRTTDEDFIANGDKIGSSFVEDKQKVADAGDECKIEYADYRNAPPANVFCFNEGEYCCAKKADRAPESKYFSPETCPYIDFICDYIREVITSCNDNMRMLTPRPTIRPRFKATDIDRLCYCRETRWPDGELAQRFKKEVKSDPCPMCINAKPAGIPREKTFDIANIRGPCGRADCRIARDLRTYLENLVEEDLEVVNIDEVHGPCGSTDCTLARKLQKFLRHEGEFSGTYTKEGLSTQCDCLERMQQALRNVDECDSTCSKNCFEARAYDQEEDMCEGTKCPFRKDLCDESKCPFKKKAVDVQYFTVEYDFEHNTKKSPSSHKELGNKLPNSNGSEPSGSTSSTIQYADYKNAQAANVLSLKEDSEPSDCHYNSYKLFQDIDSVCELVNKTIISCNDNLKMLTLRPVIKPKSRNEYIEIESLCDCNETKKIYELKNRNNFQNKLCPLCTNTHPPSKERRKLFDIANIRGPCGNPDCKVARDMRSYLDSMLTEDNQEINIDDIYGPCGSTSCTVAETLKKFIRQDEEFSTCNIKEGQCCCEDKTQEAFLRPESHEPMSNDCAACAEEKDINSNKSKVRVYDVYYFTVEYNFFGGSKKSSTEKVEGKKSRSGDNASSKSSKSDDKGKGKEKSSDSEDEKATKKPCYILDSDDDEPIAPVTKEDIEDMKEKFKYCGVLCPSKYEETPACSKVTCGDEYKKRKEGQEENKASPADSDFVVNLNALHNPCCIKTCDVADTIRDYIEEIYTKKASRSPYSAVLDPDDPCYCDCSCTFEFTSKTTYCGVCGGYECLGEDVKNMPDYAKPHPCPIYHKMFDRKYLCDPKDPFAEKSDEAIDHPEVVSIKSVKSIKSRNTEAEKLSAKFSNKVGESTKKTKKKPSIVKPVAQGERVVKKPPVPACDMVVVPPNMGWLWTAQDIPGLKPRPKWKPGAANKILVRRYRALRQGNDIIGKRKKALASRKKKVELGPTLIVKKTDGEFTVQIETFKKFSHTRLLNQFPYEEKPPIVYCVGKTEKEKEKIQKRRERRERRDMRRRCKIIQSTFRDKCQEICLKAYNQCIGCLPMPDLNQPCCECSDEDPKVPTPVIDSCSCSECSSDTSSDTDGDDWIVEFTPPAARWVPKAKPPPLKSDNTTQYCYLDFRVKVLDKNGNPVPRFFLGPDGQQECSDLGGFWGPGHVWLEINKDGYIGPDGRWVPPNFTGPDGNVYSSDEGKFTDATGRVYEIGVDGYIDQDGVWASYCKMRKGRGSAMSVISSKHKTSNKCGVSPSRSPRSLRSPTKSVKVDSTKMKAETPPSAKKGGMPTKPSVKPPPVGGARQVKTVMRLDLDKRYTPFKKYQTNANIYEQCYEEITEELRNHDDIGELPPIIRKSNRASNTPQKKSLFTLDRNIKSILQEFRNF